MTLRNYQKEAVGAVYAHLQAKKTNPCVVIPTAGGKSLVLAQIASDVATLWHGRVLILAHVKELLQQNAEKIRTLCPDVPVGVYSAGLSSRDTGEPIIVAGIQSVYQRAKELGAFDLVIVDEAHLIPEDGDGMYRTFLAESSSICPHQRIVGCTATPYRVKGGLICKPENILQEICYEVGVRRLIGEGWLSPLTAKAGKSSIDLSGLRVRMGEFVQEDVDKAVGSESAVATACADLAARTADRKSVIVFCSSVQHCKDVADRLRELTGERCAVVTGETPSAERAKIIDEFKGVVQTNLFGETEQPIKFLCNMGVLTTGFDAPCIDCVALLRPTKSAGLYVQMVGRGFRLSPETGKVNCVAEGTGILTDRGIVPVENVTREMKLWDGVEFVSHDGAVFKGEQNAIEYAGLVATPDHKVWCGREWQPFGKCAELGLPISCTGDGWTTIREADHCFRHGSCGAQTRLVETFSKICSDTMQVRTSCVEVSGQSVKGNSRLPDMRATETSAEMACQQGVICEGSLCESQKQTILGLRRAGNQVLLREPNGDGGLDYGQPGTLVRQDETNRPDRRQRKLRAWELANGHCSNEYVESAFSPDIGGNVVSAATSGDSIRRCDASPSDWRRTVGRGDCREVSPAILQTKRRVWDILNAGPRHRFTANGLLVSNCLILDYGGNILRHGPVDAVTIKEGRSRGQTGEAPMAKECPNCGELVHPAIMKCPACGFEFPKPESNLDDQARNGGILSGEVTYDTHIIVRTEYYVHTKKGAEPGTPKTVEVDYFEDFRTIHREWLCPEHVGYARQKFEKWWREHARRGVPPPRTAEECIPLCEDPSIVRRASAITVKTVAGEKWPRVVGYTLEDLADPAPAPAASAEPPEPGADLDLPPFDPQPSDDLYDDELPF